MCVGGGDIGGEPLLLQRACRKVYSVSFRWGQYDSKNLMRRVYVRMRGAYRSDAVGVSVDGDADESFCCIDAVNVLAELVDAAPFKLLEL